MQAGDDWHVWFGLQYAEGPASHPAFLLDVCAAAKCDAGPGLGLEAHEGVGEARPLAEPRTGGRSGGRRS